MSKLLEYCKIWSLKKNVYFAVDTVIHLLKHFLEVYVLDGARGGTVG